MVKDLTIGPPGKVLWRFSLPLFGSIIFQQLYNIADSLVAGKFIGENALAAVGNAYEVTLIFIAFAFGCNIGCSVIVSQLFGAKRMGDLRSAVRTALIATLVLCAGLMILGFLLSPALLHCIQTPSILFDDTLLYLNIYIGGLGFLFLYNLATGIFSALGDSKTPFLFLAFSSTANIFVDILFVQAFDMGVSGVAWATFLCQAVSCILAVLTVFRRLKSLPAADESVRFSWKLLRKISIIAIPSILQQSFISVGNIIIQGIINGYGPGVMAGYSAAIKLNNLVITSYTTLGNGISNFTAQNIGAEKWERIPQGYRSGLKMAIGIAIPIIALYFFFSQTLVQFFVDQGSSTTINTGMQFLRIVSPFYLLVATKLLTDGILRGAGAMSYFMSTTFTDLILRIVLAYLLSEQFGPIGIWIAWPIGWCIATTMSVVFYLKGVWKRRPHKEEAVSQS